MSKHFFMLVTCQTHYKHALQTGLHGNTHAGANVHTHKRALVQQCAQMDYTYIYAHVKTHVYTPVCTHVYTNALQI